MTSAIRRQRLVCSIQKSRIDLSGLASDRLPLLGCEKLVELKSSLEVVLLGPLNPALEIRSIYLVTVNELTAKLTVGFVQVEAVSTGQQALYLLDVSAQARRCCGPCRDSCP